MKIPPFELERYFAKYEFSARYLLSSSDCEPLSQADLLGTADEETRHLWESLRLGYTESLGHPLLRQEVGGLYPGLTAEETLVLVPEEGIFLLMHALLEPGDHVVCTFPGYQSLYEVARSIGCDVTYWKPDEGQGWRFELDQLKLILRNNTKLVVVNFPHNPTGYLPGAAEFAEIIEAVRIKGSYLLSDEMYRYLEIDEGHRLPPACLRYEKAVTLSGLSKAFGLPGLRIGWLASQDRSLLERVAHLKDYTTICSSAPGEILAIIGLRKKGDILRHQIERLHRNLEVLEDFMTARADDFRLSRPGGGSICFPRMSAVEDTDVFCDQLVREAGIMLLPSSQFHYGRRHVRIGFGREDFPEVLDLFDSYLDRYLSG